MNPDALYIAFKTFVVRISLKQNWIDDSLVKAGLKAGLKKREIILREGPAVQVIISTEEVNNRLNEHNGWSERIGAQWKKTKGYKILEARLQPLVHQIESETKHEVRLQKGLISSGFSLSKIKKLLEHSKNNLLDALAGEGHLTEADHQKIQQVFVPKIQEVEQLLHQEFSKIGLVYKKPRIIFLPVKDYTSIMGDEGGAGTMMGFDVILFPISIPEEDFTYSLIHEELHANEDFYKSYDISAGFDEAVTDYMAAKMMMVLEGVSGEFRTYWGKNRERFIYRDGVDEFLVFMDEYGEAPFTAAYFFNDFYHLFLEFSAADDEWENAVAFTSIALVPTIIRNGKFLLLEDRYSFLSFWSTISEEGFAPGLYS